MRKVAIIAGTHVDTAMGVEIYKKMGFDTYFYPVAKGVQAGYEFQISPMDYKIAHMTKMVQEIKDVGINDILVYCNSLSGAVDIHAVGDKLGVNVVTPHDAYRVMANDFHDIGIIAATNHSVGAIEETIAAVNPTASIVGTGMLRAVAAVEDEMPPEEIVEKLGIDILAKYHEHIGSECIILGCTHFPYFKEALEAKTKLPIIDPAKIMYDLVNAK